MNYKGLLSLLGGALVFSTFGILIRVLNTSFGQMTQIAVRFLIALVVVLLIVLARRIQIRLGRFNARAAIIFATSFPLMTIFFTQAIIQIKATNALFLLFSTSLLFSFVAGTGYFGERITGRKCIAGFLCIFGLAAFSDVFHLQLSVGVVLAILAGLFEGLANASRKVLGIGNLWVLLALQFAVGAALTVFAARVAGEVMVHHLTWPVIMVAVWFGLSIVLGSALLNYGFSHFDLNLATIVFSSELIFAMVLNRFLLGEIPTLLECLGAAAIAGAILIVNLKGFSNAYPPCQN